MEMLVGYYKKLPKYRHRPALLVLLLYSLLFLYSSNCSSQQKSKQITTDKFNYKFFDAHKVNGHYAFKLPDGTTIEQWETVGQDYIEEIRQPNSHYSTYNRYFYDTKTIVVIGEQFYTIQVGTWMSYDKAGKLLDETNYDKPFRFTIQELINKTRKMNIDITKPGNSIRVLRNELPGPRYTVVVNIDPRSDAQQRMIIFGSCLKVVEL